MAKLQEKATSGFKQYAYFDLNIAMVSYLDVDRISTIYNWLMEHIQVWQLVLNCAPVPFALLVVGYGVECYGKT